MAEIKPRLVRVVDFTAESLEAEADRMPQTRKSVADALRQMATIFRQSDNPKMIRVWEEQPEKGVSDFMKPDPASH